MTHDVSLEPEARQFAEATAKPPYLFDLGPERGRGVLEDAQSGPVRKPEVEVEERRIPAGTLGEVAVRIVRPPRATAPLPVLVYAHGGGWVVGDARTHDRLVRELAVGAGAAVVFVDYSRSPEAKYPRAAEEVYATLAWIAESGREHGLDASRLAVAGDSAGGNLAAAVTILAKQRGGPAIRRQVLFYPVTDASFETPSYRQFATGHFLRRDAMQWFWDQYTTDPARRGEITASPLRATPEQLQGLPEALVLTAEADVLRDEGEAYAARLREAGVRVTALRVLGTIHDFVMLDALSGTAAARGAILLANAWLREGFAGPR